MIDFHTHILPGIDDGSPDIETTEAMLREECAQGVELIVATPHFYANRISVHKFLDRRAGAYDRTEALRRSLTDVKLPPLLMGAEVYYFEGMGTAEMLPQLAIGDTGTILIEMPFEQWTKEVLKDLKTVIEKRKLRVVLAHVERYVEFQRNMDVFEEVMSLPLTPQINAGTFVRRKAGLFRTDRKWKFAVQFLKEHPGVILGSDCHNMEGRRPNIRDGRNAVKEACGEEALRAMDTAAREVLLL